jgi:hypothetical protein
MDYHFKYTYRGKFSILFLPTLYYDILLIKRQSKHFTVSVKSFRFPLIIWNQLHFLIFGVLLAKCKNIYMDVIWNYIMHMVSPLHFKILYVCSVSFCVFRFWWVYSWATDFCVRDYVTHQQVIWARWCWQGFHLQSSALGCHNPQDAGFTHHHSTQLPETWTVLWTHYPCR